MADKSSTQWYARNTRDYEEKTAHLSLLEHGVYSVLLDFYYKTSSPLPTSAEQLQRICRCISEDENKALASILEQYFIVKNGNYHNVRADKEIIKRAELSKKRANAAKSKTNDSQANAPPIAPAIAPTLTLTETTLSEDKSSSRVKRAHGHELPDDFKPDLESVNFCNEIGVNVQYAVSEMRDWAKSKRPKYHDWQATFRNSARRSSKNQPKNGDKHGSAWINEGDRLAAKYRAQDAAERMANGPQSEIIGGIIEDLHPATPIRKIG